MTRPFTRQELDDIETSLELGQRDNLTPILTGVLLLFSGGKWRDWTDFLVVALGVASVAYFFWRRRSDEIIHKKARTAFARQNGG